MKIVWLRPMQATSVLFGHIGLQIQIAFHLCTKTLPCFPAKQIARIIHQRIFIWMILIRRGKKYTTKLLAESNAATFYIVNIQMEYNKMHFSSLHRHC